MVQKVLLLDAITTTGQLLIQDLVSDGFEVVAHVTTENDEQQAKRCGANDTVVFDFSDDRALHDMEFMKRFDVVLCANDLAVGDKKLGDLASGQRIFSACTKLANTCAMAHTPRFIHISVINLSQSARDESTRQWMKMSAKTDTHIKDLSNRLLFTIVRTSLINDGRPTGRITCMPSIDEYTLQKHPQMTRKDLCDTVVQILKRDHTKDVFIEITAGDTPIMQALDNLKGKPIHPGGVQFHQQQTPESVS